MGIRLTQGEYEAYVELGGIKWIRDFLRDHHKHLVERRLIEIDKNPNQTELDL